MKRAIQLTILLGVALFLLSACSQTIVETSTEPTNEETITLEPAIETTDEETKETEESETVETESDVEEGETTEESSSEGTTIEITSSGFSPSTLTVSKGTTVTFITMDGGEYWPASAVHPSHTVYPTEGGCIGSTFDACKGLAEGETFEFTFDETGEWSYHDHLNPGIRGTIIVE